MIKLFPLRVVLTAVTGRLLTKAKGDRDNGIGDLYEIINHILDGNVFSHQLPYASKKCIPYLLEKFPELEKATESLSIDILDNLMENSESVGKGIDIWLEMCITEWGMKKNYTVERLKNDS